MYVSYYTMSDVCTTQGVGGTVQFPRNYLKRVYELVRQNGGLCIADEVGYIYS